ncbi:MAG: InlB B-repeat-containing protein [Clostridia bacterium]|nr:InlB B-repeat-containing protein [Clostridia bacterium]
MTKLFLEETKDEMKKINTRSNQKGVSMITLVITIVVLLILLLAAFAYSGNSINEASRAEFFQEVSLVEQQSSEKRFANQINGTGEAIENQGFYKTKIKNPPEDFVSFSEDAIYGYVVDLEYIEFDDEAKRGWDYKKFSTNTETNMAEFGVDDIYVYDKDGKVFYLGGYQTNDGVYYTKDLLEKAGPEIVSVDKTVAGDKKSVKITLVVRKINGGNLTVEVGGKDATRVSEIGTEEKYEITVYENKTYKIKATEERQGTTNSSVEVTEIDAEVYTITYNANGGTNVPAPQAKTENVIMKITNQEPLRNGYVFLGWNENATETIATYKPGSEFTLNKNTVLYAIWTTDENRTYSVMYNANGGDGAPEGAENLTGEYIISTEVPKRAGYGFEGWSTDSKAATATYHAGDTITLSENLVLYAVWERGTKTVLVTVEPEGAGTVTGNGARLAGGEVYISTTPAQGYTFKNWTVKSGGINLANTTTTSTTFTMPDNDVELVANYEINGLTVKYNGNKGSTITKTEVVEYGGEIIVTTLEPIRHGYDFVGWALSQDAKEPQYHAGDAYPVLQNTVFYAVWAEHVETYTITYNLNGGTGNKNGGIGLFAPQIKSQGGTIQVPTGGTDEPYRKDFVFKGWSLAEESDEVVLKPGDTYYKDEDLELFAVWKDETAPAGTITVRQDEGSEKIKLIATAHDEGIIAGYAWTTSDIAPIAWESEQAGTKDVEVEKEVTQKGRQYFWVKDLAGNVSVENIMIYEIKFDTNGGTGAPDTQYQAENVELTLSSNQLARERYVFLGWSTSVNPGNTESDVDYLRGGKIKLNADVTLRAVWGESFFKVSSNSGISQIDGANIIITVQKGLYTGNIEVTSENAEIATGSESNGILTIVPGTKVGETIINVREDRTGFTEKITVIINKGIRQLTLNETSKTFVFGDSSSQVGFSYRGKESATTVTSSNTSVATVNLNGKTITITPRNYGTSIVTLRIAEDDQYLERTGEIAVTVSKKEIVVTPASNQKKVYDGTAVTPKLTYSYRGNVTGEIPGFSGVLEREIGVDVGKYEIKKGTLALANNGSFIASNYTLTLSPIKVYFEITPKPITPPVAVTPQAYDGTTKYGIANGTEYTRGGQYAQVNAGKYTAVATLTDTKNYMWSDTNNTTAKNLVWEITSYNLTGGKIAVSPLASVTYTGNEIRPIPTITFDGKTTLVSGTDYTLSYSNNVNVGTATITITGRGNYSGTITTTFQITKATMQVDASDYVGTFDNQNHTITVKPTWPSSGATIYYSTTALNSSNYSSGKTSPIYYKNVGTNTIYYYIVNSNFYDHSGSRKVTINPKSIGTSITVTGVTNKDYTGSAITQNVTVKENEQNRNLVEGTDYTVSYSNNVNIGTNTAAVIITGKGNFTGTKTVNFSILGDVITINKSTDSLVSSLTVTMSKKIPVTTLQYKIDNGAWTNYTGAITITKDCTVYGRSVHNGNTIGSNQITITNICEHQYSVVSCVSDSRCIYCNLLKEEKLGHSYTSQTTTSTYLKSEATCTTKAVYYYKCVRCTEKGTNTYEYGEPLNHSYTSQTATATYLKDAATCTTKAVYYYKCIRCSAKGSTTYEYGSALNHDFTVKSMTSTYKRSEADCESPETYYYKCSRCTAAGTNYYTNGNALGHACNTKLATSTYLRTNADCTNAATYYYKCDRCSYASSKYYSSGNPLNHNFTVQSQTSAYLKSPATCTANAVYYYKCSRCSAAGSNTYTATGTATGHSWGDYSTTTAATCTSTGVKTRYCSKCGISDTASIAAKGHDYSAASSSKRTSATCSLPQTNWHKCSRCSSISSSSYYSTGSSLGHSYSAATCTTPATCTRCGVTSGSSLGHSFSTPTCTSSSSCKRCGAAGAPATGHSYGSYSTIKSATCTTDGKKRRYCQNSGCSSYQDATISATGHNYGSYVITQSGTCVTKGSKKRTCANCGDVQTAVVPLNYSIHEGPIAYQITVRATCTRASQSKGVCNACGRDTGDIKTGSKAAHSYAPATCTAPRTCKNCGATTGSALNHNYSEATCTKKATCTRCGATTGSLKSHDYGSYTTTKSATCSSTGTKVRYCDVCGKSQTASIPKTSHSYSTSYSYDSSQHYKKCKNCSAKTSEGSHKMNARDPVNRIDTCTVCGYEESY